MLVQVKHAKSRAGLKHRNRKFVFPLVEANCAHAWRKQCVKSAPLLMPQRIIWDYFRSPETYCWTAPARTSCSAISALPGRRWPDSTRCKSALEQTLRLFSPTNKHPASGPWYTPLLSKSLALSTTSRYLVFKFSRSPYRRFPWLFTVAEFSFICPRIWCSCVA